MEETIDTNFRFRHKRSQKSRLIELEVAERSSGIGVIVPVFGVVVSSRLRRSEGRGAKKHWFGNGEKGPIASSDEVWVYCAVKIGEKWRRECTHEC